MSENDLQHVERVLREIDQPEDRHVHYELAEIFERAAAAHVAHGDEQRARKLQWEFEAWRLVPVHAWELNVDGSSFKPMVTYNDGSVWPDPAAFPKAQLDYLRGRAETTQNPTIQALYWEILWDRARDPAAGRAAAEAYAEVAGALADEEVSIDLMHALTRPLTLALQLNDGALLVEARQLIRDWLTRFGNRHETLRLLELAEVLLLRATRVEQSDLEHAADVIEVAATEAEAADNWSVERAALEILIRLRTRLGADQASVDILRERIARSHVSEAEAREAESPQLATHSYGEAIAAFLQLGNARFGAEIEQLERQIKEQNLRAHEATTRFEHRFSINMSPIHEFADSLVGRDGLDDLHMLAGVDGLLPSVSEAREQTAEQRENDPILFFMPRSTFRGGNRVHVAQSDEDIFQSVLAENYGHSLGIAIRGIEIVVEKLSEAGQWQEDRVTTVLRGADLFELCDLRFLEHALRRYFAHDYVSATPMLALQVEPILRCVLARLGLATSRTDRRTAVTREKNLEEILATRELADLLGEDYVYFVRFVLLDPRGPWLRHGTAHGLLSVESFRADLAHLLVSMLLWLARFRRSASDALDSGNLE